MIKDVDETLLYIKIQNKKKIKYQLRNIFFGDVYFVIRSNVWRVYAFWLDEEPIDAYLNEIITIVCK